MGSHRENILAMCLYKPSSLKMNYTFLKSIDNCFKLADLFSDDNWLLVICHLANIKNKQAKKTTSLHGKGEEVIAFWK